MNLLSYLMIWIFIAILLMLIIAFVFQRVSLWSLL
jgi:hypothetical protein